jgi:transcriptional regulator with XRE-family HTH domain
MHEKSSTRALEGVRSPTPTLPAETAPVMRLENLSELIRRKRQADALTLEQAAQQSGVSAATLSRWERQGLAGQDDAPGKPPRVPDMRTLAALARWLGVALDRVMDVEPPAPAHGVVHREDDSVPDMVEAHLRADRHLDSETAVALGRMFRLAYEQFARLSSTEVVEDGGAPSQRDHEHDAPRRAAASEREGADEQDSGE